MQFSLFDIQTPAAVKSKEYAHKPWIEHHFICIDTETSGLDCRKNRVIELAWITYKDGKKVSHHTQLCRIPERLPAKITEITSITDDMLAQAPQFSDVAQQFVKAIDECSFIVAYNAPFDHGFIEEELRRIDLRLPEKQWVDPLVIIKEIDRYKRGKKLSDAAMRWGVEISNAHRALNDAEATASLLLKLESQIKQKNLNEYMKQQESWRKAQDAEYAAHRAKQGRFGYGAPQ